VVRGWLANEGSVDGARCFPPALSDSGSKETFNRSVQHLRSLNLRFKERDDCPDPVSKDLPDLGHVFILHLDPIENEFYRILPNLFLLNHTVDNDTPDWNPEFMKPIDETRDDGDWKAFRQCHEEEGCKGFVGQQCLRMGHPVLEPQEVVQEGILLFLF